MRDALLDELERNIETARTTKRMIDRERDMLQGDLEDRLTLHTFHTDIWDALVNSGDLVRFEGDLAPVADAYRHIRELNEIIVRFHERGNHITHAPLMSGTVEGYGRKETVDIIREKCDETEIALRDATDAVDDLLDRTCPACGKTFETPGGVKSHITQTDDRAHRAHRDGR